jgi:carboxypeptidase A1
MWTERPSAPGVITIQIQKEHLSWLLQKTKTFNIEHSTLHGDLQEDIDQFFERNRMAQESSSNFFNAYANFDQMESYLTQLQAAYPTLATIQTIGTTLEGRNITAIIISGEGDASTKPAFLMNGCQHAREWISPMTVAYIAQALLTNYTTNTDVKAIVDYFQWIIIPIVNGDGYVYTWTTDRMWRKNRDTQNSPTCVGVDTNRNWGYEWGTGGSSSIPCSDTYMGPSSFSEPEETAVANYISANTRVRAYIDYHAYGDLFMYPWGYTCTSKPTNYVTQQDGATQYANALKSVNGLVFETGTVCNTIYLASGGSNDWTYGGANVPYSYACELRGNSFVIPPENIIPSGQENFAGVVSLATFVQKN